MSSNTHATVGVCVQENGNESGTILEGGAGRRVDSGMSGVGKGCQEKWLSMVFPVDLQQEHGGLCEAFSGRERKSGREDERSELRHFWRW